MGSSLALSVRKLAEDAVAATQNDPEGSPLTLTDVLRLLDSDGNRNRHLRNPLNHPRDGYIKPRAVPLTGDEPVHGDFLALTYCAHDPFVRLDDHESLEQLEKFLASDSGTINFYITCSIAFIRGSVVPYRIGYELDDKTVGVFDKHLQDTRGAQPAEKAAKRWIIWGAGSLPAAISELSLTLRNAEESDADTLADLWHSGWQDTHAPILPAELARHRTLESFRERMRAHLADVRVAGRVGAPLGFSMIKDDELYQFYVSAAARGTGVAPVLLTDAERLLRSRGVRDAWLACAIGNERAARFYGKCGWRRAGTATIDVEIPGGTYPLEVWRFEKILE